MKGMKKYYVGGLVLLVATVGIIGYVLFIGLDGRQDMQTEKRSREIETKLNAYMDSKREIPKDLATAGVTDVPSTITYTKKSDSEFTFCAKYKHASNNGVVGGIENIVGGGAVGDVQMSYDQAQATTMPETYFYVGYSHTKGDNCQTVQPYSVTGSYYDQANWPAYSDDTMLGAQGVAKDSERQTDILALHGQLEAFYASELKYPTLEQINSTSWRQQYMRGLDDEALRDPDATAMTLYGTPSMGAYAYAATGSGGQVCNNTSVDCVNYTLTATLSDANTYVKENLN